MRVYTVTQNDSQKMRKINTVYTAFKWLMELKFGSHPYRSNREMQFNRHKYFNKRYLKQYKFLRTCGVQPF